MTRGDLHAVAAWREKPFRTWTAAGNTNSFHDRSGKAFEALMLLGAARESLKNHANERAQQGDSVAWTVVASWFAFEEEEPIVAAIAGGGLAAVGNRLAGAMARRAGGRIATSLAEGAGARAAGGACFVEDTEVHGADGVRPIEKVEVGDRVLAFAPEAVSTDGGEDAWIELETSLATKGAVWAPRAFGMACAALTTGCEVAPEMPAPGDVVHVYDARTGAWSEGFGAELELGDTFVDDGRVFRVTEAGAEVRGEAAIEDLAEADATWVAEVAHRVPGGDDWVLVLGEVDEAGHWRLSEVEPGERFAFQGRVFETADVDDDFDLEVRVTKLVLSRVLETFVRQSETVIDAEIQYEDGSIEVITGTPEHPFYVPALQDWVPLGKLAEGTELHVDSGPGVVLVGKTWRHGDFTVYNFEVETQHNYFVRAPASDSAALLVHNTCGWIKDMMKSQAPAPDMLTKGVHVTVDGVELAARPTGDGTIVWKTVFSADEGTEAAAKAMGKAEKALESGEFRGWLSKRAEQGKTLAAQEGDAKYLEFKRLQQDLEKMEQ